MRDSQDTPKWSALGCGCCGISMSTTRCGRCLTWQGLCGLWKLPLRSRGHFLGVACHQKSVLAHHSCSGQMVWHKIPRLGSVSWIAYRKCSYLPGITCKSYGFLWISHGDTPPTLSLTRPLAVAALFYRCRYCLCRCRHLVDVGVGGSFLMVWTHWDSWIRWNFCGLDGLFWKFVLWMAIIWDHHNYWIND